VWVDGALLAPGVPAISPEDPGFLLGLAVFETLLCEEGRLFFVEEHLERLRAGAAALGIDVPADWLAARGLNEVVRALAGRSAAIRITLTPGAPGQGLRTVLTTRPWSAPPAEGVAVLLIEGAKLAGGEVEGLKTTSRARNVLARAQAERRGAWEALLGTEAGDLSEGSVSNLFVVVDGELRTPSLERGCLAGILRAKVLELARARGIPCRECRVERVDLARAGEVFLTSSLARILPVTEILDLRRDLPRGGGPLTRELQAGLAEAERCQPEAGGVPARGPGAAKG
jgi:branched-chain amino acid aminotransferase